MPGWGPIGRFAVGEIGGGAVQVALATRATASARARVTGSFTGALAAKANAQAKARVTTTASSAVLGRVAAQAKMRAPAGFALAGKTAAQAKARTAPGYILFAKAMMMSTGLSSLHLEGTLTPPRLPLLLNSGSQYGASYWKGRD